jgi:hypothetical protein
MENKEDILNRIGSGWHRYIDIIYAMLPELSFCAGITSVQRSNGMLNVRFSRDDLTTPAQELILSSIEYKLERITARVCEHCGIHGNRRTALPETKTLCTRCYAFEYSELHPTPSKMAYPEPQKEY